MCLGAQSAFSGNKRWEKRYPQVAAALQQLAEAHAQQDPSFRGSIAYTRLTAAEALKQLQAQGWSQEQITCPQYHGGGAQPHGLPSAQSRQSQTAKKIPETDLIFANIETRDPQALDPQAKRLSRVKPLSPWGSMLGEVKLAAMIKLRSMTWAARNAISLVGSLTRTVVSYSSALAVPTKPVISSTLLSALSQQVQSDGTLLGHSGTTLEWG